MDAGQGSRKKVVEILRGNIRSSAHIMVPRGNSKFPKRGALRDSLGGGERGQQEGEGGVGGVKKSSSEPGGPVMA